MALDETLAEQSERWRKLIAAVQRRHRREPMRFIEGDHCIRCREPWPCPEARLVEALYGAG